MLSVFRPVQRAFGCVAVMMLLVGAMSTPAAAGSQLQPEDLLSVVQLPQFPETSVVISPDGRRLAYVTATRIPGAADSPKYDFRGPGRKQLWIVSAEGGRPIRIGSASTDNWAPAWSPNASYLAFYSGVGDQNSLAIFDASRGHVRSLPIRVDTDAPVAKWLIDSTRLLVPMVHPHKGALPVKPSSTSAPDASPTPKIGVFTSTPQPEAQTKEHGDVISPAADWGKKFDLSIVDVRSGKLLSTVVRNIRPTTYKFSPDSTKLLYAVETGEVSEDINDRVIFDLRVVDLRSGSSSVVAKGVLTAYDAETLSWSPDGSTIAYVGGNLKDDSALIPGYGSSFPGHLYMVSVTHQAALRRVSDTLLSRFQGPLQWSDDNSAIYATDEPYKSISRISLATGESTAIYTLPSGAFKPYVGKLLYRVGNHTYAVADAGDGAQDVYDFDLKTGHARQVFHRYQNIAKLTFSSDGTRAAYIGQDATRTEDAWVAGDAFAQPHQVTHLNPQIEERALGSGQSVSWQTKDGRTFEGALLLPAGYRAGERYPMIVWVYAGEPEGTRSRNAFGISWGTEFVYLNLQLYASRGYAVFIPNSELRVGTPMQDIADVILPGVDKIVAMGIADPNRLGVMGQSYGGYSTLALIVQSNRFKAAVATSGIYDIFSFYGTLGPDGSDWTSWSESEQGRMGGTPWQYQQRYIDNSPFFFLDRVQTPVLLEYGTEDKAAAVNADEAFIGLRRLGKEVTLVRYAGEDHVIVGRTNQLDLTHRILDWFALHLGVPGSARASL